MLQRSPSYVVARPGQDALADRIRALLPEKLAHRVVRGKNVVMGTLFFQLMRRLPRRAALALRERVAAQLPASIPVDPHFVPSYDPWDQRLCLVPDADLFRALRSGKADIVTDRIDAVHAVRGPAGIGPLAAGGRHRDGDGPAPGGVRRDRADGRRPRDRTGRAARRTRA